MNEEKEMGGQKEGGSEIEKKGSKRQRWGVFS